MLRAFKALILLLVLTAAFNSYCEEQQSENMPEEGKNSEENAEKQPKSKNFIQRIFSDDKKEDKDKLGWVLFPVMFYSSDTNFGFGASAVIFKEHYRDEFVSKSNSFSTVFFYTLRNQLMNVNVGNLYWNQAKWNWRSKLMFKKYPTDFYGIGPNSKESEHEVFEPFQFEFSNSINRRIWHSLYGGISLTQGYHEIMKTKKGGLAEKYYSDCRKKGFISGIGLRLSYDSTNDSFYPTSGSKIEVMYQYYPFWLGSQYNFSRFYLDGATFIKIPIPKWESVLGLQLVFEGTGGEAPLPYLPSLGDQDIMRGYTGRRFRDKYFIASQAEWRFPIYWRFGGVLFFGLGKVQSNFTDFIFDDLKYGGGFGIRFRLARKKNINFRFDMGFTPEGFKFYFNLLEAF